MTTSTYERDFYQWTQDQADLLRNGRFSALDVDHLVEELESMGARERRELRNRLKVLVAHLLKWQYQPQRRSDSWLDSITDARTQIELAIQDSPSLINYPEKQLEPSYQKARRQASKQTGIPLSVFPVKCSYSLELILDEDWLPEKDD